MVAPTVAMNGNNFTVYMYLPCALSIRSVCVDVVWVGCECGMWASPAMRRQDVLTLRVRNTSD